MIRANVQQLSDNSDEFLVSDVRILVAVIPRTLFEKK
jgi:hypothetical protein